MRRPPKRPSVTLRCPADRSAFPGQRIIEFSFPDGSGGLMSFATDGQGRPTIAVYRHDDPIVVAVCSSGTRRPVARRRSPSNSVEIVMKTPPDPTRSSRQKCPDCRGRMLPDDPRQGTRTCGTCAGRGFIQQEPRS